MARCQLVAALDIVGCSLTTRCSGLATLAAELDIVGRLNRKRIAPRRFVSRRRVRASGFLNTRSRLSGFQARPHRAFVASLVLFRSAHSARLRLAACTCCAPGAQKRAQGGQPAGFIPRIGFPAARSGCAEFRVSARFKAGFLRAGQAHYLFTAYLTLVRVAPLNAFQRHRLLQAARHGRNR